MPLAEDPDVMAAVDRSGGTARYVIADVTVDDAWLAVRDGDALPLRSWR